MGKFILLGLYILLPFVLFAQKDSSNQLIWQENRGLSWDDFQGSTIEGTNLGGEVLCQLSANFEKANLFSKTIYKVAAIFNKKLSWASSSFRNIQALRYFQGTFDLYEIYARKLRAELSSVKRNFNPAKDLKLKYDETMTALTNELEQYRKDTKLGSDTSELVRWTAKISIELKDLATYK